MEEMFPKLIDKPRTWTSRAAPVVISRGCGPAPVVMMGKQMGKHLEIGKQKSRQTRRTEFADTLHVAIHLHHRYHVNRSESYIKQSCNVCPISSGNVP
jgi:hypothetical protein